MGKKRSGAKFSLKATLQSQQSRLQNKQKAAFAAQAAEQKQKAKKRGSRPMISREGAPSRVTIPFRPIDKILLIGEGNFSFARALTLDSPPLELEHLPAENVTATAYDSEKDCFEKYPDAEGIVQRLREKGVEVLFGVDGSKLEKVVALRGRKWDRIVWNFPHAGRGITDQDRNILCNQMLILGFLRSAAGCLSLGISPSPTPRIRKRKSNGDHEDDMSDGAQTDDNDNLKLDEQIVSLASESNKTRGTLLITLRNVPPYTLWNVSKLAKTPPPPTSIYSKPNPQYTLLRSFVFHRDAWKGYEHRMTKGERAHGQGKTGEGGEDRTWEFYLKD